MRALVCAVVLLAGGSLRADQGPATGSIVGTVKDVGGAPVDGVTVVATSRSLRGTLAEITDRKGRFAIRGVPPGRYLVTSYAGESKYERDGVVVTSGKSKALAIKLTNPIPFATDTGSKGSIDVWTTHCASYSGSCWGTMSEPVPLRPTSRW